MFDITPDDINQLNDVDLRELVGRLCEAELVSLGLSPAAVTWGGNQTAADGGLDVRVALPLGVSIEGFIPSPSTGFQVKTPDMPRAAILAEMRPTGAIRPVIQELADEAGAYVIVSSNGATADRALRNRRHALRAALDDVVNADRLHTDFYDRTRLATWVRCHPGMIAWIKEKVGRAHVGWHPYGPWSGAAESVDAEYLLDDKLRLLFGRHRDVCEQPITQTIDELRDELAQPRKIVRLVGLSGVGKTRLVQALFDARIGSRPLPPTLAVYTNLSDNPDPPPIGLASEFIANRKRAILVVDNCPPDLHHRLSDLCSGERSTVSLLTVEYDVRDDQPEGTQVVTLDTSSPELIEKLVQRRYTHLSRIDARSIADASGGNARIAIALAETVERSDTIAGLTNEELFQRLFRQRNAPSDALLLAAQACSLVYSFQGETFVGDEAELPRLATLAGQTAAETYRHVGELLRRNLVQQRGVWRAVLPHAIANRLASRALEDIPYDLINQQLVEGGTERLLRSFSRRLSFLHDHPRAIAIVKSWFAPNGLLGNVTALNDLGQAMFQNVAPVQPEAALAALERVGDSAPDVAAMVWQRHLSLLRSLAYDPLLFERSAHLLARAATYSKGEHDAKKASDTFISLFPIYVSGTHATIEQRLGVIEHLLRLSEANSRTLGVAALNRLLRTGRFGSNYRFDFGARSRDYGYQPQSNADVTRWYGAALSLVERLALTEEELQPELRELLARNFRGLWLSVHMHSEVERLSRRFAADKFWCEGWVACRQTIKFHKDQLSPEDALRLSTLESELRPSDLPERVRAVVLGSSSWGFNLEDMDVDDDLMTASERRETVARELGATVVGDATVFAELLPDLLRGGNGAFSFGRGLASASPDLRASWARLVNGLGLMAPEQRNIQLLRGFLCELWERDRNLAQNLLDAALDQPALVMFLPALHSAVALDDRGVERLKRALSMGQVSVLTYRSLAFGRGVDHLKGDVLKELLLLIAKQPDGFEVALEILEMRLYSDRSAQRNFEPKLLQAGRELLRCITFPKNNQRDIHNLTDVVKVCLTGLEAEPIAAAVAMQLRQAVATGEIYSFENDTLLTALLEVQPAAVLDALFQGDEDDRQAGINVFEHLVGDQCNPADAISCETLIAWCERDRDCRYPLAASIITFARHSDANASLVWSEQAKVLFASAPNPRSVLTLLIERFRPTSWSGSYAALIEANARLLDSLEPLVSSCLMPFVTETKAQLAQEVAEERQWEMNRSRERDERFE